MDFLAFHASLFHSALPLLLAVQPVVLLHGHVVLRPVVVQLRHFFDLHTLYPVNRDALLVIRNCIIGRMHHTVAYHDVFSVTRKNANPLLSPLLSQTTESFNVSTLVLPLSRDLVCHEAVDVALVPFPPSTQVLLCFGLRGPATSRGCLAHA